MAREPFVIWSEHWSLMLQEIPFFSVVFFIFFPPFPYFGFLFLYPLFSTFRFLLNRSFNLLFCFSFVFFQLWRYVFFLLRLVLFRFYFCLFLLFLRWRILFIIFNVLTPSFFAIFGLCCLFGLNQ